jgi:peptidoglycan/xylan/chitin deacetylase (PgdA/CDA1 family)
MIFNSKSELMYIRIFALVISSLLISGKIKAQAPSVAVCNYLNNKDAAVSITFDDGCKDQFQIGQSIMDNLGFEGTFFIITSYTPSKGFDYGCSLNLTWSNLQNAINHGHEIGSHTVHHSLLDTLYYKYGADTVESEIRKSRDTLNKYLNGQKVLTFAYPEGDGGDGSSESVLVRKLLHKYYIGARAAGVCPAGYDTYPYATGTGFGDFYYQVESFPMHNTTTLSEYTQMLDGAIQHGGWFVPMYHNFNQNVDLSVTTSGFTDQMNAINDRKSDLWVAPFRDVLKYHKEKTSATATIPAYSSSLIVVGLTDTITNPEFDMPLTLVVSNLASNSEIDSVKQGSNKLSFFRKGNSVQFNARPDKGNINIYKSTIVVSAPSLTTIAVSSITSSGASSGGNVTSDGNASVTSRGVCWSTSANPTISSSKTSNGSGTGNFTSTISGLSANTIYYIRAYATNSAGTSYGNELSFTTNPTHLPALNTAAISSVTSSSASAGGNVSDDGGAPITERGVCWSTTSNPTVSNFKIVNGSGGGSFTCSIIGLNSGTTYYVRAYAINSVGTVYGNEISFTTGTVTPTETLPVLTTLACSLITSSSASSGGNVSDDGNATVNSKGVCWSLSSNPTISDHKTVDGTGEGSFTSSITNLSANTLYYVRAYATNSAGTSYGNEQSFTTSSPTAIAHISTSTYVSVYPNPSPGIFHLTISSYGSPLLELKIINASGVVVYKEDLHQFRGDYTKEIDGKGFINGLYCLEILTEKERIMQKVIIQ